MYQGYLLQSYYAQSTVEHFSPIPISNKAFHLLDYYLEDPLLALALVPMT